MIIKEETIVLLSDVSGAFSNKLKRTLLSLNDVETYLNNQD
ncbi:11812_t:CDS:1, partial [Gigaspora rosea]